MKLTFLFIFIIIALMAANSYAQNSGAFSNINVDEFKQKMAESNTVILDVRTPNEIAQGKIEGTLEINFFDSNFTSKIQQLDKTKTYLVYCRSGNRSGKACNIMSKNGFEHLYNLEGGFNAWKVNN